MYYADELVKRLKASEKIVIYGARIVAGEVANCLMSPVYGLQIDAFMVSDKEGNPPELFGCRVVDIAEGAAQYKDALVIIAVLERYEDAIRKNLCRFGFHNVVSLTFESDLWSEIRGNYYKACLEGMGKAYLTLEQELERQACGNMDSARLISLYRASCHVDRKLTDISKYSWEKKIQVGAALTDREIARIRDDWGDNISLKNPWYCELTALYWIWKNDRVSKYAGLCHYRRHFDMTAEDAAGIVDSDIDVVLTIPILNFPNVKTAYIHDHVEDDWNIMMSAIDRISPEYSAAARQIEMWNYYYAYNMFIARKEILDAYCEWLFPILEYCERHCRAKADTYQSRYIGFLAERLLTIFFVKHWDEWKIVHARKEFFKG